MADDIPQDVMEAAEEAYQQAIYMTTSDDPKNMVRMVARAILAERERCAGIADFGVKWTPPRDFQAIVDESCAEIARAIRSPDQKQVG